MSAQEQGNPNVADQNEAYVASSLPPSPFFSLACLSLSSTNPSHFRMCVVRAANIRTRTPSFEGLVYQPKIQPVPFRATLVNVRPPPFLTLITLI